LIDFTDIFNSPMAYQISNFISRLHINLMGAGGMPD